MGAINVDNTGSGGAITLSSDGTNLLPGGTAVGGDLALSRETASGHTPTAASPDTHEGA